MSGSYLARNLFRRIFSIAAVVFLYATLGYAEQPNPLSPALNSYTFSRLGNSQGLSSNRVNCVYKDRAGFVWFGTSDGLNRFDGSAFRLFSCKADDSTSLASNTVSAIFEGPDNSLWIKHPGGKLSIYQPQNEKFSRRADDWFRRMSIGDQPLISMTKDKTGHFWFLQPYRLSCYDPGNGKMSRYANRKNDSLSISKANNTGMSEDSEGNTWLIHSDGVLEKFDQATKKITFRSAKMKGVFGNIGVDFRCFADRDGDVWVYTPFDANGAWYLHTGNATWKHLNMTGGDLRLNSNTVNAISQDARGMIWLATVYGGVNLIDKSEWTVRYLLTDESRSNRIAQNTVNALYNDNQGVMWVGTSKQGVSYYHESPVSFPLERILLRGNSGLAVKNDAGSFAEDPDGNLWIGTYGDGLLHYSKKTGRFTQYRHDPANGNSLPNDKVNSIYLDSSQKLWVSSFWGGLDCFDGKKFIHYRHRTEDPASLSDDRVTKIIGSRDHQLWVATMAGLDRLDPKTGRFVHFVPGSPGNKSPARVFSIAEDDQGNIWMGTQHGLYALRKSTGRIVNYPLHKNEDSNNRVSIVYAGRQGLIWAATEEGITVFNTATHTYTPLSRDNGLPSNTIFAIQETSRGALWISSLNTLTHIIATLKNNKLSFRIRNYNEEDGPVGNEFNENSAFLTHDQQLLFGSAAGFIRFDPLRVKDHSFVYRPVLTDFFLLNNRLEVAQQKNGRIILDKPVNELHDLELKYDENIFAIEFTSLDFLDPDKLRYAYKMEGFDKSWVFPDNRTKRATYTNLDPGEYVFRLKNTDTEGRWTGTERVLKIRILPPFWKSMLAYCTYFIGICCGLYQVRRRGIRKLKEEFALDNEKRETQRLLEEERREGKRLLDAERERAGQERKLSDMKIKFFTNVSHEFKTPISLVLSPVEKLIREADRPETVTQLQLVQRNARRLLNMVSQLLDFRKMEEQELKLQLVSGDIIAFIRESAVAFTDMAERKQINFLVDSDCERFDTCFDPDKIERIVFNLLANAFKFTPEGGNVSVLMVMEDKSGRQPKLLELKVIDNGIGIASEKHERVFDVFFQDDVPASILNQGSGIGLSIVKEFVHLHNGTVFVESEPGKGSSFSVILPLDDQRISGYPATEKIPQPYHDEYGKIPVKKAGSKRPVLLLVEDNDELRTYLKENLENEFTIAEATNGKLGWQKALALHPDLVLSDVSMPEMSGIELCAKLKQDKRTLHIPVILLTAHCAEQDQLTCLQTGANDYLAKPFNLAILLSRIRNLICLKENFETTFRKQVNIQLQEMEAVSEDELFINKMLHYMETNMARGVITIEEMSSYMCMSRVSLYKRILALTGKAPVEFVNSIKLKKAAQLMERTQMKISEIAYAVGFNSPKYFCRVFKAEFKVIPSVYMNELRGVKGEEASVAGLVEVGEEAS